MPRGGKIKHGMCGTRTHEIWRGMIKRCLRPSHQSYKFYGAKGITVCERWLQFENFYADMGERPAGDISLDRIDNTSGYSPENCRWATRVQQNNNRSDNRQITYGGRTMTATEWAAITGLPSRRIYSRIFQHGWPIEKALFRKARPTGR